MNNKAEWWDFVINNREALTDIILQYHPSQKNDNYMPITAPNVEVVRKMLAEGMSKNKVTETYVDFCFDNLDDGLYHLLDEAWFGVPESTDCWNIKGFSELCTALVNGDVFDE